MATKVEAAGSSDILGATVRPTWPGPALELTVAAPLRQVLTILAPVAKRARPLHAEVLAKLRLPTAGRLLGAMRVLPAAVSSF